MRCSILYTQLTEPTLHWFIFLYAAVSAAAPSGCIFLGNLGESGSNFRFKLQFHFFLTSNSIEYGNYYC